MKQTYTLRIDLGGTVTSLDADFDQLMGDTRVCHLYEILDPASYGYWCEALLASIDRGLDRVDVSLWFINDFGIKIETRTTILSDDSGFLLCISPILKPYSDGKRCAVCSTQHSRIWFDIKGQPKSLCSICTSIKYFTYLLE